MDWGIKFNDSKLQYRQTRVKFIGHQWSHNQIMVDPDRVKAIDALKEPSTKVKLQKALGSFNYVRKFVPQMADVAAPLYGLLSDSVRFEWLPSILKASTN